MSLTDQLDRLAAFEPAPYPVVSLYLNAQPGQHGRDQFQAFIRKEFKARARTYPAKSSERDSLERDLDRIARYLETELDPSTNGVAIFACSAGEMFEAVQLAAPVEQNWLYIGDQPHLYPLARLESRYPRYAALVVDTNTARIIVFATGEVAATHEVSNPKTRRTSQGGWSQSRFQRRISDAHMHHAKEVIDALQQIVDRERVPHVIIAGDEVITPALRAQMPKALADKIVDEVKLDVHAPLDEIVRVSLDSMARLDERTDLEKVEAAIGAYRSGGLGVVGPEETLAALIKGQVDELLLTASLRHLDRLPSWVEAVNDSALAEPAVEVAAAGEAAGAEPEVVRLADELVTKAQQTSAKVTFIEDPALLADHGGVAALLRFTI